MAKPIRALELHYPMIQFLIITIIFFVCQNVRITGVSTVVTGRLLMALPIINVTVVSALDGSALKGLLAQECQLRVHPPTGVTRMLPPRSMAVTPQWQTVR